MICSSKRGFGYDLVKPNHKNEMVKSLLFKRRCVVHGIRNLGSFNDTTGLEPLEIIQTY
jgi:hypothetical protein